MVTNSNSFLRATKLFHYYTRFWGFGHFTVPQKRNTTEKVQMKAFDIISLAVESSSFVALIIMQIIFRPARRPTVGANATLIERVSQLLYLTAMVGYVVNLYFEFRYRSKFSGMISRLHHFDVAVCWKGNLIKNILFYFLLKTKSFWLHRSSFLMQLQI